VIAYTKVKILLEKYGFWGTVPFHRTGATGETTDLIMGGVEFGKFAVDFLAFILLAR